MTPDTVFLRLQGPLQSWGDTSKFLIRRTMDAPTKSGVLGLICSAMGLPRERARDRLHELNRLKFAVRIDRPGRLWWDWHTVGAGTGLTTAAGGVKTGTRATLITRREYLADASFLVALQGDSELIAKVREALLNPVWPPFLGRRSCPPSLPLLGRRDELDTGCFDDLESALKAVKWRPRLPDEDPPPSLECLIEWRKSPSQPVAPLDAEVWYDVPTSFDVPGHEPRFVVRKWLAVGPRQDVEIGEPMQRPTPPPPRPRANYTNSDYKRARARRLEADGHLCVFCKAPATTVQHVTYRRAGGNETQEDLRSLCRYCHDAVTMIEYGLGMGLDRINPEDPSYREKIIARREEIIRFRSLATRRRLLRAEEVE